MNSGAEPTVAGEIVTDLAPGTLARALGYRAGILQSSAMGFGVYRRLGFAHVCNIDNYYWVAPS